VAAEVGRQIARYAIENYLKPVPYLREGAMLNSGEFQLNLTTGRTEPFIIETSSDLVTWSPWQTNLLGVIRLQDTNAAATDHRFYRVY
jgi:hypothetical protein